MKFVPNRAQIARLVGGCQIALALAVAAPVMADTPPEKGATTVTAPLKLDPSVLAGAGLNEVPPVPKEYLLTGDSRPRSQILYQGNELKVEVYEEREISFPLPPEGMPYDEFVHVLAGALILTDTNGVATEYNAGDFLVIPKGFKGTWASRGTFRELVVIERSAWEATHGSREE